MANVKTTVDSFAAGESKTAAADAYASSKPHFASAVDAYAHNTGIGLHAGGPHNRPASGQECETCG